jgi:hypothetical protein
MASSSGYVRNSKVVGREERIAVDPKTGSELVMQSAFGMEKQDRDAAERHRRAERRGNEGKWAVGLR